jgi:hypothetical protein
MSTKSQTLGSLAASRTPDQVVVCPWFPTVSRWVRSCARARSSGVNHHVVRGSFGRMKKPDRATMRVTTPWMMKSHCQPAIPACEICQRLVRSGSKLTRRTYHAVHFENAQGDQSCESCGEDVTSVEDRDPRGQLFSRVERGQNIQCSRVVRSLRNTEEESREQQACVIPADSSQATDDSPHSHARGHPDAGLHTCNHHIGRNADDNVTGEQNGDTSLVLLWSKTKVFFEGV